MRTLHAGLILSLILCLIACTPDPSRYVEKKKYDELQGKLEFVQARLDAAEKRITDYESHRYSLFNSGIRTFRVDSITGDTCIKLTSAGDWKRSEVQRQSCDCWDYVNGNGEKTEEWRKLYCGS